MNDLNLPPRPTRPASLAALLMLTLAASCSGDDDENFSAGLDGSNADEATETEDLPEGECGNGEVEAGEQCDLGEGNAPEAQCTPACQIAACGDGYANADYEECDDGNQDENDGCLNDCTANVCGDGILNEGVELCDDGNSINTDDCSNECVPGTCGDGVIDNNEQCDDGNQSDEDGCPSCSYAYCGDGHVWAGHEECDDANEDEDDACLEGCVAATCGDGILWEGTETCDDGNHEDDDACPGSCHDAFCGDGYVYTAAGETCDDGNNVSDDGCDADCLAEYCFRVANDAEENLEGNDWFDECVMAVGDLIVVKLRDSEGTVIYEAEGTKVGEWSQEAITSTNSNGNEYNEGSHNQMISLSNGDVLFISSQDADTGGSYTCNTELGDGYGIVVYPSSPNWYFNPKLTVFPYEGAHSNTARAFKNWGPEYEIAWNEGAGMNTCTEGEGGLVPFEGAFTLRVMPQ
ncbi:DUF4215 domain-containing protein [Pseudenhygromyxa sp. WMMC2535]|uniref:DUF4215 domain-containing protein n=1 Tax=Pseudenhygromyxa sp. WMMC2535 TaxID=2712867 RepID=UPI001553BB29|nr:DUF4215 domain-containing protein [Pseudenhygromyxa sp. WMMC2535]NVB41162.1 DUF4215 domain-containing protein [Pseudenhygromyxa sp. WMMC2535]